MTTPNVPSSILAKRNRDDVGVLGRKKSKGPLSLRAMKQIAGLMSSSGRPFATDSQSPPSTPLAVQATVASPTPPTPYSLLVQEVSVLLPTAVIASVPLAAPIVAPASTTVTPLLSACVMTTSAPKISPPSSSASPITISTILASVLPSSYSRPIVFLDHVYPSRDIDST